jgi:hypothetical protein
MSESMGGIIPECPGDFVGIRNEHTEWAVWLPKNLKRPAASGAKRSLA